MHPPPRPRPQLKQRAGGHDLASVLLPAPTPDGLALAGFTTSPPHVAGAASSGGAQAAAAGGGGKGGLQAPQSVEVAEKDPGSMAQFRFELVKACHVGPTGALGGGGWRHRSFTPPAAPAGWSQGACVFSRQPGRRSNQALAATGPAPRSRYIFGP